MGKNKLRSSGKRKPGKKNSSNKISNNNNNKTGGGVWKKKRVKKPKHTWRSVREKKRGRGGGGPDESATTGESSTTVVEQTGSPSNKRNDNKCGSEDKGSTLRSRMMQRLNVARFRQLNESVDSQNPTSGGVNPLANAKTFERYHAGFESASSSWTVNPLDKIISWISENVSSDKTVADFGCGNARLSQSIPNRTHSFDLHALNDHVTECDMRSVPLPDSSVDVAVFCLSLMGKDVTPFIVEAARVLKIGGVLIVCEVIGRLGGGVDSFSKSVSRVGFKVVGVEEVQGGDLFAVITFKRVKGGGKKRDARRGSNKPVLLNASVYKKR